MSTIKVNTLTTLDGTGNITFSRPIVGDGSNLTGVAPTKTSIEALGIDLPAANLTGTIPLPTTVTAFFGYLTSATGDVSGDDADINFNSVTYPWTEIYDVGNNWSNGLFTAPTTGKYLLYGTMAHAGLDTAHSYIDSRLVTSNVNIRICHENESTSAAKGTRHSRFSYIMQMEASDTAYLQLSVAGSTANTCGVSGGSLGMYFGGSLISED